MRLLVGRRESGRPITVQAVWKATVLAESSRTVSVDGKRYFPPEDVRWDVLRRNHKETVCAWKGYASYYDVEVAGRLKRSVAWVYADPQPAATELKGCVAFSRAVKVRRAPGERPRKADERALGS